MNEKLYIPDKIKIGYQKRTDTYSGLLAYITYISDKGELKKAKSWEGWRDKKIPESFVDNSPIEGFVLNRQVGGASRHSWDSRLEKIRVWDPRGFEIEITIPNMLFLLETSSSIPGKGLSGEYVYSWSGQQLVLLPTNCKEYNESKKFTTNFSKKIDPKSLVPGYTYLTKEMFKVVYLGYFDLYRDLRYHYGGDFITPNKAHVIYYLDRTYYQIDSIDLKNITEEVSSDVVSNFAKLIDELAKISGKKPTLSISEEHAPIPFTEKGKPSGYYGRFEYTTKGQVSGYRSVGDDYLKEDELIIGNYKQSEKSIFKKIDNNNYLYVRIKRLKEKSTVEEAYSDSRYAEDKSFLNSYKSMHKFWKQSGYKIISNKVYSFEGGELKIKPTKKYQDDNLYQKADIEAMNLITLKVNNKYI